MPPRSSARSTPARSARLSSFTSSAPAELRGPGGEAALRPARRGPGLVPSRAVGRPVATTLDEESGRGSDRLPRRGGELGRRARRLFLPTGPISSASSRSSPARSSIERRSCAHRSIRAVTAHGSHSHSAARAAPASVPPGRWPGVASSVSTTTASPVSHAFSGSFRHGQRRHPGARVARGWQDALVRRLRR